MRPYVKLLRPLVRPGNAPASELKLETDKTPGVRTESFMLSTLYVVTLLSRRITCEHSYTVSQKRPTFVLL